MSISDPIFADFNDDLPPAQTKPIKRNKKAKELVPEGFDFRGQLTSTEDIIRYARAGQAIFTLQSLKTGTRFTFKVTEPDNKNYVSFFVGLLTGPNNTQDYTYMGCVKNGYNGERFTLTQASKVSKEAPSYKAFEYFWQKIMVHKRDINELGMVVWHEGRCCRCARPLTVPESVAWGIGPECRSKMGL